MKKRIISVLLIFFFASSISILSFAAETEVIGSALRRVESEETVEAQDGYALVSADSDEEGRNQIKRQMASTGIHTYQMGENIIAVLSADGVLTVSGQGEMQTYSNYTEIPWYGERTNVKSIVINEGITKISRYAFVECYYATKVEIASTVESIGEGAFYNCSSLTSVSLSDSVKTIETAAFANCYGLESVDFGTGLESIGNYVFQGVKMTKLTLPEGLKTIGDYIAYSSRVEKITIPASAEVIGAIGYGAEYLTEIEVSFGNANYISVDGVLFTADMLKLKSYPAAKSGSQYTVPKIVTSISSYAFAYTTNLKTVNIQGNVTAIGDWCFYNAGLEQVVIPDSVTSVGDGAFEKCAALTSVEIGSGVTATSYRMFQDCTSLETVTLKDGLKKIGMRFVVNNSKLVKIILPSTLTDIEECAFYNCQSLTEVNIPENVEYIGEDAFYNCSQLNITVPEGLEKLENGCYRKVLKLAISGTYYYDKAYEVLEIVNKERTAAGLSTLTMDKELLEAAMLRAAETCIDFSHDRPNGESCFSITDKASGENIAAGNSTAEGTMNQWMNSSGHKANILGSGYQSIGIGCFYQDGVYFWVQVFGGETAQTLTQPENKDVTLDILSSLNREYKLYYPYDDLQIYAGNTKQMTGGLINNGWEYVCAILNADNFDWSVDKTKIAKVDKNGVITGLTAGKANVTFTLKEMSSVSESGSFEILKNTDSKGNTIHIEEEKGQQFVYNNAKYEISNVKNKTLTYVGNKKKSAKTISIPDTVMVNGSKYKVTKIGKAALKNNKKITTVKIGKNVSKIGKQAFYGCKKLKNLTILSVKLKSGNIGGDAFKKTYSKIKVKVPKSKYKVYKSMLRKKGLSKKAKITKI